MNNQAKQHEQHQSHRLSEWVYVAIGLVFIVLAVLAIVRPGSGAESLL